MTMKKNKDNNKLSPFDFINAINSGKYVLDENNEKDYLPYTVNKGFSYFTDTILYSNEINLYHKVDIKLQFDYLINSIRPRKRFEKWAKKVDDVDLNLVREYYGYNIAKANEALTILSPEQLTRIKERLDKGG